MTNYPHEPLVISADELLKTGVEAKKKARQALLRKIRHRRAVALQERGRRHGY